MAITIKVGAAAEKAQETEQQAAPPVPIDFKLNMRRSLNNDIMIGDHPDVDIVVNLKKVVLFPKESLNDIAYDTQDRFFRFLRKKGIVNPETIRSGNVYGSLEGSLVATDDQDDVLPLVIMNVSKFIEADRPYFEYLEKYQEMEEEEYLDPDRADSTELGEVPQGEEKGGIRPGYGRVSPYFLSYIL
tara:strand:+ start:1215 stop:1775 length:561 start_codon:yes stop_codon:yes gene_type:complete